MAAIATRMGSRMAAARRPRVRPPCELSLETLTDPPETKGVVVLAATLDPEAEVDVGALILNTVKAGPAGKGDKKSKSSLAVIPSYVETKR
jgi:hypothetical protein